MKLEVLGCSGNVTRHHRTVAYLVNDRVLFDAGTVTDVLAPVRLKRISHVFLSHIHLDHVKGLCSLAEELSMSEDRSVTVLADEQVINAISRHVFNDYLWPDFTAIPEKEHPVVRLQIMDPIGDITVHDLSVRAIPVHHRIHTTGFLVREGENTIMLTSDTGMTEQFWRTAKGETHVEFIIAHVAFPSRLLDLARKSGHMTLSLLLKQVDDYSLHKVPVYISHMKSMFEDEIRVEITKAGRQNFRVLEQGSVLVV
jgi:cAMP phosphodiesterase